ncbi:MAG: DUF420 domain-containing protein [Planctomycetaceae bacterium]
MENGFLGHNASFMLDVIVCALVLIVPTLVASLYLVKVRRAYAVHRNIQLALGVVLLTAVTAFEIDIRQHGGWEAIVNKPGQPQRLAGDSLAYVTSVLRVHLVFAISTPLLWAVTILLALKRFPSPPLPGDHSNLHKKLGWLSAVDIVLTSITGLYWYYIAFVA